MEREEFEGLVARAVESLPPEFQHKLENVDIVVEEWPTAAQLRRAKTKSPRAIAWPLSGCASNQARARVRISLA